MQTQYWHHENAADCPQLGMRCRHRLIATLVAVWIALGSSALASASSPVGGDVDFGFYTNALNDHVTCLAVQTNGQILVGGQFTTVNGIFCGRVARLNSDGTFDSAYANGLAGANNVVMCAALQTNGKALIGGFFTAVNGVSRGYVARLNTDGALDTSFGNGVAGASAVVYSLAVQGDGKVLIGGTFTAVNGVARGCVARLNSDGSLDTAFGNGQAGANTTVYSITALSNGKMLIAGSFTNVNGTARGRIARLNSDGSLDTTFGNGLTGAGSSVSAVAAQGDGKVLIGGMFNSVNGTTRRRLARLNSDGSLDTAFLSGLAGPDNVVQCILLQPDGKILPAGDFSALNGVARGRIGRLLSDGTLDTTFGDNLAGADSTSLLAMALQSDGKVVIGGWFAHVNGESRPYLARLWGAAPVVPPDLPTTAAALDAGGQRVSSALYTVDGSVGMIGSAAAVGDAVLKAGFIGQLTEVTNLAVIAQPQAVNEGGTAQLAGVARLDDGTATTLAGGEIAWGTPALPVMTIATNGVATVTNVCATTAGTVAGAYLGMPGSGVLLVLDSSPDNFGLYAGDGLPDAWQSRYFGQNNPAGLASATNPSGRNNRYSYTADLDPTNPASLFQIVALSNQPPGRAVYFLPASTGRVYTLQYTTDLRSGPWTDVTPAGTRGNGGAFWLSDTNTVSPRFYRVNVQAP